MIELEQRITRLEEQINQIVRVGTVTTVCPDTGKVKVNIADADSLVSYDLPVLFPKTHLDQYYHMPDSGEHVLCVFLPFGLEQGFVLGAIYSKVDQPPVHGQDKHHVKYNDGTTIEYDRSLHKLEINCVGEVVVKSATHIQGLAPRIDWN